MSIWDKKTITGFRKNNVSHSLRWLLEIKIPLALKFFIIIAAINLVLFAIILHLQRQNSEENIRWELKHDGQNVEDITLRHIELYFNDKYKQRIIQSIAFLTEKESGSEIRNIRIYNVHGEALESFGKDIKVKEELVKKALAEKKTVYDDSVYYILNMYVPIFGETDGEPDEDILRGLSFVNIDFSFRAKEVNKDINVMIAIMLVSMLLAAAAIFSFFYWSVMKPLKRLEVGAALIGKGSFILPQNDYYIRRDEIGFLETALQKMALRLKELFAEKDESSKVLRESEELYKSLINTSPDGIIITDKDGYVAFASEKMLDIYGYESDNDIIGRSYLDWIDPSDHERITSGMNSVLNGNLRTSKEYLMLRKNGEKFYGEVSAQSIKDSNGTPKGVLSITRDISERKKFERSLIEAKEQISLVIDSLPLMVAYVGWDEKYIYVNKFYAECFGKCKEDIIGKQVRDILGEKTYIEDAKDAITKIFKGETVYAEHPVYNYMGKYVFGSFIYVPHFGENGKVKGYLVMIQDITENKKQQEELISAKEKAEKSDKLKTEFLAQMSHEIRTPINAILSFTSLIREQVAGKLDNELADSFTIINKAGERIIRTIQLILDMSQIQTGAYEPVLRRQDIYSDILVKLFVEHKENAKEKNLEFLLRKETNNSEVLGDEYTLRQIYGNLIDNAIKYTFKGRVEVVVWRDDKNKLAISIRDTGIGISKEYMDDLFQPFTQEEMGYTRKFEGNGLGLAIVKKFCEVNKAHLYVQSEKGKGSCFTTIFPQN